VRTRRVQKNPTDLLPVIKRTPQRYIDTFSESELEDLLALPHLDAVLMTILVDAGLRKGEARTLQVRRLKVDTGELIIGGKGDKDRLVPMTIRLRTALEGFLLLEQLNPNDFLWYTRPGGAAVSRRKEIGEGSFYRWWKRCLDQAGVRYRNPHTCRHTFATRWLRGGGRLETVSVVHGPRVHPHDVRPVRAPGHPRRARRPAPDRGKRLGRAKSLRTEPSVHAGRGADRIRTGETVHNTWTGGA
jgi:integrase